MAANPPPLPNPPAGDTKPAPKWVQTTTAVSPLIGVGVLMLVGLYVLYVIWDALREQDNLLGALKEPEVARGLITFLIAIVTIAIAIILTLYVAMSNAAEATVKERFAMGKEVLTVLVGILGTIVGFYFGANQSAPAASSAAIQIAPATLPSPAPKRGEEFTFTSAITGGKAPYDYTISFEPAGLILDKTGVAEVKGKSEDGKINHPLKVAETLTADTQVGYQIEVKDAAGTTRTYQATATEKIPVKVQ